MFGYRVLAHRWPEAVGDDIISTANLLCHLDMEDGSGTTATDQSGNGNDGTLEADAAFSTTSKVGTYSVVLDGSEGDAVSLGNLTYDATDDVTIALFVRMTAFTPSDYRVLSKSTGTAEADHYAMISGTGGVGARKFRIRFKAGGTTTTLIGSTDTLVVDTWYHVVLWYDGSDLKFYLDGSEDATVSKTGAIDEGAAVEFSVGVEPGTVYGEINGYVDDLRIYERALTTGEISTLASQ